MASPESLGSPLAGSLTRTQSKDALRRIQMSLETLQRQIDESMVQIGEIPRRELHSFLSRQRNACQRWHREQCQEWAVLLGEDEEEEDSQDAKARKSEVSTPFGVTLRSLEDRMSRMGGIPALGSGLVLPRMTPGSKPVLAATASPAALEVARSRAEGPGGAPVTPLRHISGARDDDQGEGPAATARATLRRTPAIPPPELRQGLQSTGLQEDFAAAMRRRQQALEMAGND